MTRNQTASQTVVVVAMGLVAGACAVALNQHAGMPGPVAATVALSAYLLLLTVHALAWRKAARGTTDVARARGIQVATGRRKAETAPPKMPAPGPQIGPLGQAPLGESSLGMPGVLKTPAAAGPQFGAPGLRPGQPPMPPAPEQKARAPLPPAPPAVPPQQLPRQADRGAPPPLPMPAAAPLQATRTTPPPMPNTAQSPAGPSDDDLQDIWSFRPAATGQKLPPFVTGRAAATQNDPKLPEPQASTPRPADVEVIQDAIKRLLEEVNAAEQSRAAPAHPATAGSAPPPLPQAQSPEANIERSIDALRMTAGSMRAAMGPEAAPYPTPAPMMAAPPQPPPVPAPPQTARPSRPTPSADARARLMADAISAGRIDVTLEPILGLEDQQTRHYEVTVRLRDADGNALDVTPNGPDLRGTGLLPLFDGVRVARTAAVARRLEERGKGGSIFSMFSGESVADEHFLGELAETLHTRGSLASQLVLSFTQTDVRGFSTPEWDSLADMRALGFRFAITHMTDLDMDFEALADQGFVFSKLDASVFLSGLPAPSGHIPSADVCRHLASHGLTLVVERIENDEQLARIFGFGVLLGQGQLFGGARPVRADVVNDRARGANTAAA